MKMKFNAGFCSSLRAISQHFHNEGNNIFIVFESFAVADLESKLYFIFSLPKYYESRINCHVLTIKSR